MGEQNPIDPPLEESNHLRHRLAELEPLERRSQQAEQALLRSEAQYRSTLDSMPDAIHVVDADLRVVLFNQTFSEWCRNLGLEMDVIGRPLGEVFPFLSARVFQEYHRAFQTGELVVSQEHTRVGEKEFVTETRKIPIVEEGHVVRVVTVVRDVTERVRAEQELQERRLYLEEVLTAAPNAIVTLDAQHRIVEWNPGAEQVFGYTREEVVGHDLDTLITKPDMMEQASSMTRAVLSGHDVPLTETVRYRKDGSPVSVILAGSPILVGDELIGVVAVYRDITEHKRTEEALQRYAREMESRNEDLDAFAHSVAHDLKGPLSTLLVYAEILERDYSTLPADRVQDYLHLVARTGRKMSNIVTELLLLASVRKTDVELRPLEMGRIVAEACQRLHDAIEESQARILLPIAWPEALGYAPWVEEVWFNYLSNAFKYGGQPPEVELGGTEEEGGMVRFWVRDNGPGIPGEGLPRLFTPFTQLSPVRARGQGLGLSIVRRIVEKLGGEVRAENDPQAGSQFSFTLPALQ